MPLRKAALRLLLLAPLGLAACAAPLLPAPGPAATVSIATAPYGVAAMAMAERWEAGDVFQYEVTLYAVEGATDVVAVPARTLLQKQATPATTTTFSGLTAGKTYKVGVVARGNADGSAPDQALNMLVPTLEAFTITAGTSGVAVTAHVALDPLDVSLPVDFAAPTQDGGFAAPAATEAVTIDGVEQVGMEVNR